jgi:hypothetical protein
LDQGVICDAIIFNALQVVFWMMVLVMHVLRTLGKITGMTLVAMAVEYVL